MRLATAALVAELAAIAAPREPIDVVLDLALGRGGPAAVAAYQAITRHHGQIGDAGVNALLAELDRA